MNVTTVEVMGTPVGWLSEDGTYYRGWTNDWGILWDACAGDESLPTAALAWTPVDSTTQE